MEKNYQFLDIELNKPIYRKLSAIQYDNNSRYILVSIYSNFKPYDLTYASVKIYGIKKDKTVFFNNAKILDAKNGKFEIDLTEQCLAVDGEVEIQILILGVNQERLSSNSFILNVKKNIIEPIKVTSQDEWGALTEGLANLAEYDVYKNNVTRHDVEIKENKSKIDEAYSRLNNIVFLSIEDFERQSNDTSDSQRINRALDVLRRNIDESEINNVKSGGKLFFPRGIYEIDETILLDPNIEIEGIGVNLTTAKKFADNLSGNANTIIKWIGNDNKVMIEGRPFNVLSRDRANIPYNDMLHDSLDNYLLTRVNIKNINLLGTGRQIGIKLNYAPGSEIKNVGVQNVDVGIAFKDSWGITIDNTNILSHGQGIVAFGSNGGGRIINSYINGYGYDGNPETYTNDLVLKAVEDNNAVGINTWKTGLYINQSSGLYVSGCIIEHWDRAIFNNKSARNKFSVIHVEDYYKCAYHSNNAVFTIDNLKANQNNKDLNDAQGGIFIFENCVHTSYIRNLWQSNLSDLGSSTGGYKVNKCLCVNATGVENSIIIEGYRPLKNDKFFKQIVLKDIGSGVEGKPTIYYVDNSLGDDNNFGCTANFPLRTLQTAIDRGAKTIYVNGNYTIENEINIVDKNVQIIFKSGSNLLRSDNWYFIKITNSKVKFANLSHTLEANSLIKIDGVNDIVFEDTSIEMKQQTSILRTEYESCSVSNIVFKKSNINRVGLDERMYLISSGNSGKGAILNVVMATNNLVKLTDDTTKYKIISV